MQALPSYISCRTPSRNTQPGGREAGDRLCVCLPWRPLRPSPVGDSKSAVHRAVGAEQTRYHFRLRQHGSQLPVQCTTSEVYKFSSGSKFSTASCTCRTCCRIMCRMPLLHTAILRSPMYVHTRNWSGEQSY